MAEGEDFGQEKPPLLVTVKRLLEEYPDGQIFKVCKCVIIQVLYVVPVYFNNLWFGQFKVCLKINCSHAVEVAKYDRDTRGAMPRSGLVDV